MPYTVTIHDKLVHIKWHGTLVQADLQRVSRELPELASKMSVLPDVLHTFEGVVTFQLTLPHVQEHSENRSHLVLSKRVRSAVVANRPLVEEMAKIFRGLNRNPSIEMEIFQSKEDALLWLMQDKLHAMAVEA